MTLGWPCTDVLCDNQARLGYLLCEECRGDAAKKAAFELARLALAGYWRDRKEGRSPAWWQQRYGQKLGRPNGGKVRCPQHPHKFVHARGACKECYMARYRAERALVAA